MRNNQLDWDVVLPYALFAYNCAVSKATNEVPFTIVFGREPPPAIFDDDLDSAGCIRRTADPSKWREEVRTFLSEKFLDEMQQQNLRH